MDQATKALAEALFKSGYSDPHGDAVDRAWMAVEQYAGYREGILRGLLRDSGYDVVALAALNKIVGATLLDNDNIAACQSGSNAGVRMRLRATLLDNDNTTGRNLMNEHGFAPDTPMPRRRRRNRADIRQAYLAGVTVGAAHGTEGMEERFDLWFQALSPGPSSLEPDDGELEHERDYWHEKYEAALNKEDKMNEGPEIVGATLYDGDNIAALQARAERLQGELKEHRGKLEAVGKYLAISEAADDQEVVRQIDAYLHRSDDRGAT